jgi:hypothetical protein
VCPHHSVRKIFDCGVEEGGIDMVPSGKEPMVLAETDGKKENSEKAKIMNCFMTVLLNTD